MTTLLLAANTGGLVNILVMFLVAIIAIVVIAGLIYAVETWIIKGPLPNGVRLVIGLIIIVLIVILILQHFGGGM